MPGRGAPYGIPAGGMPAGGACIGGPPGGGMPAIGRIGGPPGGPAGLAAGAPDICKLQRSWMSGRTGPKT